MITTAQESPSVAQLLKRKRDKGPKADVYRRLGVAANTYNTWESGMYVPGDEYAEGLADYLEVELPDIVWMLYRDRIRQAKGVYRSSISRPLIAA